MAANPIAYHVNGPAYVYVGDAGMSGSLQQLGLTLDGVDIIVNQYDEPIQTDKSGPHVADEMQDFGQDAMIRLKLTQYDLAVLRLVRARRNANREGGSATRGGLIFNGGMGLRVVITSDTDEPWRFFWCIARGPRGAKVGTVRTAQDLSFYATERELPAKGAGMWLYDHDPK